MILTGLMIMQSPCIAMGEELLTESGNGDTQEADFVALSEENLPEEVFSVDELTAETDDLPADEIMDEDSGLAEEGDLLEEEDLEDIESSMIQEDASEEEVQAVEASEPDSVGQIEESAAADDLQPGAEEETVPEVTEEEEESNFKKQAADDFYALAGLIVSGMTSASDEPEMVGTSQETKEYASQLLKNYILENGKTDEEGDYYISSVQTVNDTAVTSNIYYLNATNEFFLETFYNDTIEGTTYVSTVWMSIDYAGSSAADISYFLDHASTKETYVSATAKIETPSEYKGTETLDFNVEGLDQDLLDYEIQDLANISLKAAFAMWNSIFLDKVGISMQTFGFDAYKMTHKHSYVDVVLKTASTSEDGAARVTCSTCGDIKESTVISRIAPIELDVTKFTYNKQVQLPKPVVTDSNNKVVNTKYYDVSYSNENSKKVGSYTVTVTLKDRYTGSETLSYSIQKSTASTPKQPKLASPYNDAKGIGVKFYKVSNAKQYVIFRKSSGKWKTIRTISANDSRLAASGKTLAYIDTTVKNKYGKTYTYSVAVKIGDDISSFDTKGAAMCRLAPPKVTAARKTGAGKVVVSWEAASSAQRYELQYYSAGQGKWIKCPATKKLSRTVTGLTPGKKYAFRVRCYKKSSTRGTYYSYYSNKRYVTM